MFDPEVIARAVEQDCDAQMALAQGYHQAGKLGLLPVEDAFACALKRGRLSVREGNLHHAHQLAAMVGLAARFATPRDLSVGAQLAGESVALFNLLAGATNYAHAAEAQADLMREVREASAVHGSAVVEIAKAFRLDDHD